MTQKKQITLQDIASELGVSKVAVSKALRDHPDISIETKALVQKTAVSLGYVPNFMARNLSTRRSNTIGLVVPKVAHHFFAEAIEAIYETADAYDYEIIMTVSQEDADNELKHIQTLLSMRVDGLLISVTEQTRDLAIFETIKKRKIPIVFFDRVIENFGVSCVTSDDEQGTFDAISQLIFSGYSKIAHLGGYSSSTIGKNRMQGYLRAIKEFNLDIPQSWIVESGYGEECGYTGFKKLFKSGPLPEVIFTVTYPVALGVILAAQELELTITDDFELLCFGGSNYNRFINPSLSYIKQPIYKTGQRAVEILIHEIMNPEHQPSQLKLPTELVICETCKGKSGGILDGQV